MRASLQRKVIYIVSLLVLMILLFNMGFPARIIIQPGGEVRTTPGGILAQQRTAAELTEAQMGEIDPASSTIKLATFGMRGVAIALLWHQIGEKQKRHEWNDVVATANQIIFLEPHFITVWDYLGWDLSYNASADFDDYRERYRWAIRGIDFLLTGLKKNQRSPKLHEKIGWSISQKIGIADEAEQYRRLLRDDDDFGSRHDCPLPSDRDNWLLGRRWYHMGEDLVLSGVSIANQSDFVYFANSRLNLFNYAKWLRKDGVFGVDAIKAWNNALDEWKDFGKIELATAIPVDGTFHMTKKNKAHRAKLETTDIVQQEADQLIEELHSIAPELKETLCIERWKELGELPGQQGSLLPYLEKVDELNAKFYPIVELQTIRRWLDENEPDWKTRLTAERNSSIPADQTEMRKVPAMFQDEEDRAALSKTDGEIAQVTQRSLAMLRITPALLKDAIQELDIPRELKNRARGIVGELDGHKERRHYSDLFRGILNYDSRFREVAIQTTQQADDAQHIRYDARKAYYEGRLADSLNGWLDAMRKWDELLDLEEFKYLSSDAEFVRDQIDIAEKLLIILDDSNKIFSDVSDDPVPLRRLMWYRVFQDATAPPGMAALDFAKKAFEQALAETDADKRNEGLEKAEQYFLSVAKSFVSINFQEKYMEYAPFFELRDAMVEVSAYYIKSLEAQGKPFPEPLVLRSYVELMLKHDPAVTAVNEILMNAVPLLQEEKYDEALVLLDKAVAAWQVILEKYPIIAHDPTNSTYVDVARLAMQYAEVLRAKGQSVPDDFPLKTFLR
jgi:hypothetical protein